MRINNHFMLNYLPFIFLSLAIVLFGFLYAESHAYLLSRWNDIGEGDYGHGYIVLFVSIYIILSERQKLSKLKISYSMLGLLLTLISSLVWAGSSVIGVMAIQSVALVFLLLGMVWAMLGTAYIKHLAFPILYLLFAIPIWTLLAPTLQIFVADTVYPIARLLSIPVLREGQLLILPYGQLSIEEACSGLRYLLAAVTLGVLYGYFNHSTFKARLWVVCIAIIVSIIGNIIRVVGIVYLAYATEMKHPWVEDHLMLGWIIFGILFFCLLAIDALIFNRRHQSAPISAELHTPPPSTFTPPAQKPTTPRYVTLAFVFLFTASGPLLVQQYKGINIESNFDHDRYKLYPYINGWSKIDTPPSQAWNPNFIGAEEKMALYANDDMRVHVYYGYYPNQQQGSEIINEINSISGNTGWRSVRSTPALVTDTNGTKFLEQIIQDVHGEKHVVWYRYTISGYDTVDKYTAKALQALGVLIGRHEADVVAIRAKLSPGLDVTRNILSDFYQGVVVSTRSEHQSGRKV